MVGNVVYVTLMMLVSGSLAMLSAACVLSGGPQVPAE